MVLVSPGTQVSVTDESFFASAGPGTVPLIFIATKENKLTPDGTAIATGTTAATADSLFLMSSQRELLQTFGIPDFNEVGGSSRHGFPLNEFGLLAAYSYLGAANRAYVIRGDIDLAELEASSVEPTSDPANDTYWNNVNNLIPGLFEWDGAAWVEVTGIEQVLTTALIADAAPEPSSGWSDGDIIINIDEVGNFQYMQRDGVNGEWNLIGDAAWRIANASDFHWAPHTFVPTATGIGDLWLKTTTPNNGLSVDLSHYDSSLDQFVTDIVTISNNHTTYYNRATVDSSNVPAGTVVGFVDPNNAFVGFDPTVAPTPQTTSLARVDLEVHNGNSTVVVTGTDAATAPTVVTTFNINGTTVSDLNGLSIDAIVISLNSDFVTDVGFNDDNLVASKTSTGQLVITEADGRDIVLDNYVGDVSNLFLPTAPFTASNFETFTLYEASETQPAGAVTAGTYWYDPSFIVDILENDGAGAWAEFTGPIFIQSDEPTSPLITANGLWLETDQLENYPVLYRRNVADTEWILIDNTDQTTPDGIVFADARANPDQGTDFDTDIPDPLLYPGGMLLFNTRYSGRNVKIWTEDATALTSAPTVLVDRWVSASGNNADGSLISGTDAQKKIVTDAIAAVIAANDDVRNDTIFYNLIAAPGYPELIDEMLTLNTDRKEQAFVIGDSPFDLAANATALQNWSSNANNAPGNGDDGLVSASSNLGVYYPSGLSTNTDGSEVVVPASHMVLRVMASNDAVAYPWFAPAGFTRGLVSNASAVGYLTSTDEFVSVALNQGQRDTLQQNNVNPIANLPNRGLVVFGQKTRLGTASALDRVNVARLINFIRFQADQLAQPFLFEPNDSVTRDAVRNAYDSFLAELVTLRGLQDFLVVVDESNNTPARIDRNELWIDIAVQPIKSVEFIFIPIRIRNTGDDLNL